VENDEPERLRILIPYSCFARPQVGTTWGYSPSGLSDGSQLHSSVMSALFREDSLPSERLPYEERVLRGA
jgi:hypothetical protein